MVMGTTQRGAALPSLLALELRLYFSTLEKDDSNHTIAKWNYKNQANHSMTWMEMYA